MVEDPNGAADRVLLWYAIGIIMGDEECDEDAAFHHLRARAQLRHCSVQEMARRTILDRHPELDDV